MSEKNPYLRYLCEGAEQALLSQMRKTMANRYASLDSLTEREQERREIMAAEAFYLIRRSLNSKLKIAAQVIQERTDLWVDAGEAYIQISMVGVEYARLLAATDPLVDMALKDGDVQKRLKIYASYLGQYFLSEHITDTLPTVSVNSGPHFTNRPEWS